jgi:hypothetical protein
MTTLIAAETAPAAHPRVLSPLPLMPVGIIVIAKTAFQLAFAGRYGWHRDELYLFTMGRHLAAGYVDISPLTPTIAHAVDLVAGPSLVALRATAALAGALTVVVVALTARELGGGRYAQVFAAFITATSPFLLGMNAMFQPVSFDALVWAAIWFLVVRLLQTRDRRLLIAIGTVVGVGIETKYTVAALTGAVLIAILGSTHSRRLPSGRLAWTGALVAALIAAPNLWWQAAHGWPSIAFFTGQNHDVRAEYTPAKYLVELGLLVGVVGLPLCIAGAVSLWRTATFRPVAVAPGIVVVGLLLAGGKGYYAAPAFLGLYAAGAVTVERHIENGHPWMRRALPALIAMPLAIVPIGVPVLPAKTMVAWGLTSIRSDYAEELGWPEFVDTVTSAYEGLPAGEQATLVILTGNYGEAGALTLLGAHRHLPPVVSGHLGFGALPLTRPDSTHLLVVGYEPKWLHHYCTDIRTLSTVHNRYAVENEENGGSVLLCDLRSPLGEIWPDLKHS